MSDRTEEQEEGRYVPGEWECPQCRFTLQKNFLHAQDGTVSTNDEDVREVCPNDGVTLRRQTWASRSRMAEKIALDELERANAAEVEGARFREIVQRIADSPGWINSNRLAWLKCRPGNIWLGDDPTRCYHGRLVGQCEQLCPARIAFLALAREPELGTDPTEEAPVQDNETRVRALEAEVARLREALGAIATQAHYVTNVGPEDQFAVWVYAEATEALD